MAGYLIHGTKMLMRIIQKVTCPKCKKVVLGSKSELRFMKSWSSPTRTAWNFSSTYMSYYLDRHHHNASAPPSSNTPSPFAFPANLKEKMDC